MTAEKRAPKVFVTQELPVSYEKAERHGEVVFLSSREVTQTTGSLRNADILRHMVSAMKDYQPGVDYLVPSGSPLTIGIGFMIASWKGPKIRVLQWDNRGLDYREYTVDLDGLIEHAFGGNYHRPTQG